MFNIANFSAHLNRTGTVQTNKFLVRLTPPLIFGPSDIELGRIYQFRASSVRIPGVNLDMQKVNRYGLGPQQNFPTNVNFSDIDITFLDTGENELWKHFTKWMNGIFDYTGVVGGTQASYSVEYKKYYETEVQIFVFNNSGDAVNGIILKEAFPTSINDVSLSWSENNKLYEFGVKFTFKEWYYVGYENVRYESGATLGPGQTAEPIRRPTESPRPEQTAEERRMAAVRGPGR